MYKIPRILYQKKLGNGGEGVKRAFTDMDRRIKYYMKTNQEKNQKRLTARMATGLHSTLLPDYSASGARKKRTHKSTAESQTQANLRATWTRYTNKDERQ